MNKFLLFILCSFLLSACINQNTYTDFHSFKNGEWNKDSIYHFEVNISDTINPHQIFVETRNNNLYPYRNIWLFIKLETPSGSVRKDTIGFDLADDYGEWLGKGINIYKLERLYEESFVFRQPGIYTFSIRQGMRDDVLKGINEIGIKLTK